MMFSSLQVNAKTAKKYLPWLIAVAMFIDTLDSTIVGVAIPAIAKSFAINPVDMKLALTGYLLSLAIFIPISGWLADFFGEKKVFILAMAIFTTSSIFCAFSPNLVSLIIARIAQGLGGALMMPVGRLIMLRSYSKTEFNKAMSLVVIPGLLGPMLGPTLGGLILKVASWHWIFLVNIPLGILGCLLSLIYLPTNSKIKAYPFNWLGFILFSLSLSFLTFALALLGDNFNLLWHALVLDVLGAFFMTGYIKISAQQKFPLFNSNLFKQNSFTVSMGITLLTRPSLSSVPFLLPLLLQLVWKQSAFFSGMAFMFVAIGMISGRFFLNNKLFVAWGYKTTLYILITLISLVSMVLAYFTEPRAFYQLAFLLLIIGLLTSQLYITVNSLTYSDLDAEHFSQATSISSTAQQFAAGIGIAFAAILLHALSYFLKQPLFSSAVFFWTFVTINSINFLALFLVIHLKNNEKAENPKVLITH